MNEKEKEELREWIREARVLLGQVSYIIEQIETLADKAATMHYMLADTIKAQMERLKMGDEDE